MLNFKVFNLLHNECRKGIIHRLFCVCKGFVCFASWKGKKAAVWGYFLPVSYLYCVFAQAQQSTSGAAASNSHSTAASSDPPKATFPAYTQPSVSSSSSTSSSNPSSSTVAKPPATVATKPATLTTTSATSKLIHPDEDISLVSCLSFLFCPFHSK